MKKRLTKFAQVAGIMLALTFTLSCSDDKDEGGSSSQSGGGDVSSSSGNNNGVGGDGSSSSANGGGGGSSSSVTGGCPNAEIGDNTLSCGGQTYKTVEIGSQVWMAENLNYRGTEPDTLGRCYGEDSANCEKYGRLYYGSQAMIVCPAGWHLPDTTEWKKLVNSAGGADKAGTKLKAASGWNAAVKGCSSCPLTPAGTDNYGFSALPGGDGDCSVRPCEFYRVGNDGSWWSSTEFTNGNRGLYYRGMNYSYEGVSSSNYRYFQNRVLSVRCVKDEQEEIE